MNQNMSLKTTIKITVRDEETQREVSEEISPQELRLNYVTADFVLQQIEVRLRDKLKEKVAQQNKIQTLKAAPSRVADCKHCSGSGWIGQESAYGRIVQVHCPDCFNTGKGGGDHIGFRSANALKQKPQTKIQ
jgi:DnaJ-class molecular chaperone